MMRLLTAITACAACSAHTGPPDPAVRARPATPTTARSPFGIAWGMLYGIPDGQRHAFMPELRRLGAGFTRVNLFWSQLEPEPGRYRWDDLDALLAQTRSPDGLIVTLYGASPWATRTP